MIPLSTLGVATLFNAQKNVPLLLSMRYTKGQLYYQVITHPFEQQSLLAIYRHSVVQPVLPGNKIVEMGSEPWCNTQMQQYTPNLAGQVVWRADSKTFVLQNADTTGATDAPGLYMFTTGESHGQPLLTDAQDFVWG